jgi:hypothetical protein
MAIHQGETVIIKAVFQHTPAPPVRVWIQRPRQSAADAPITMSLVQDSSTTFEAEYLVADAGRHLIRVESATPIAAEEMYFSVEAKRLTKEV